MIFWTLMVLFAILIPALIGLVITIEHNELEEKRKRGEKKIQPWERPVTKYGGRY